MSTAHHLYSTSAQPDNPGAQRPSRRSRAGSWRVLRLVGCIAWLTGSAVAAPASADTTPATAAAQAGSPKQLVNDTIDAALKVLRDPKYKGDAKLRMSKLRSLVDAIFNWEAMAKSSIGPQWRKLNEAERNEFVTVFKELLAQQYMDDIDRFQGEENLKVTGSDTQAAGLVKVKTILVTTSREEVPIDYTLNKASGRWQVEDVSIEGVSMVNHYRSSFSRFLVNNEFKALLERLKRRLGPA